MVCDWLLESFTGYVFMCCCKGQWRQHEQICLGECSFEILSKTPLGAGYGPLGPAGRDRKAADVYQCIKNHLHQPHQRPHASRADRTQIHGTLAFEKAYANSVIYRTMRCMIVSARRFNNFSCNKCYGAHADQVNSSNEQTDSVVIARGA